MKSVRIKSNAVKAEKTLDGTMKVKPKKDSFLFETLAFKEGKLYTVIAISNSGWYRIMTDLEEDYLFNPEWFEIAEGENA